MKLTLYKETIWYSEKYDHIVTVKLTTYSGIEVRVNGSVPLELYFVNMLDLIKDYTRIGYVD